MKHYPPPVIETWISQCLYYETKPTFRSCFRPIWRMPDSLIFSDWLEEQGLLSYKDCLMYLIENKKGPNTISYMKYWWFLCNPSPKGLYEEDEGPDWNHIPPRQYPWERQRVEFDSKEEAVWELMINWKL